jgi:hypothetical protein
VKKEVEDRFENEKWHRISEAIKASGGRRYPPAAVQRKVKELQKIIELQKKTPDAKAGKEGGRDAS